MAIPQFRLRAAAVHAAPAYMDKDATTIKVLKIIESAGEKGIQLDRVLSLLFPLHRLDYEKVTIGPQYFIEAYPPLNQVHALTQYAQQSVVCNDSDLSIQAIQAACRRAGVTISLGVSERMAGGFTLFNSQIFIGSSGNILGVHRKLQPTFAERYVWAQGDGSTLKVWEVHSEEEAYKLGGLCCWENTMNGARQTLIEQGQHVHAAAWPALSTMKGFETVADVQIEALMKAHALTAQAFVLCAANYVDDSCLEWMEKNLGPQDLVKKGGGWTAVLHPFCAFLAGPHTGGEEKLVEAELDFESLGPVKVWIDGNGHYRRPEVLEMKVNTKPMWPAQVIEESTRSGESNQR